jgi:hypothetical protein
MMCLFAFAVGLGNFASGRDVRLSDLIDDIAATLPLLGSYGSTGNLAFGNADPDQIRRFLERLIRRQWGVISVDPLDEALRHLSTIPAPTPPDPTQQRVTRGLAFAVRPGRAGQLISNQRAHLQRLSEDLVAVWKFDQLRPNGTLNPNQRGGGWGAISTDIERRIGGRWTSRSRRTFDGLRGRAGGCDDCGGGGASVGAFVPSPPPTGRAGIAVDPHAADDDAPRSRRAR